jgi:hypothetical protein
MIDVCGVSVHYLATGAGPAAALNAPTQLLVHPLAPFSASVGG